MKAIDLSKYIIAKHDLVDEFISNKKLQKLLYYIEAWALVHIGSIIDDEFEAWVHGPVIHEVYQTYRHFGYSPISFTYPNNEPNASKFIADFENEYIENGGNSNVFKLIDSVLNEYNELNAFQLEYLTHNEDPWMFARKDVFPHGHSNNIISKDIMKEYYTKQMLEEIES